jgi:Domain of unknown function DUF29
MKTLKNLHDRDFNLWTEQMKIALENRDVNAMDWNNLIEEIEDMGASQKRALDSYVQRLIEHILKLKYWESEIDKCRNGWMKEVTNFRNQINRILKKNPSLKNYLKDEYQDIYQDAIKVMRYDFYIPETNFVEIEEIMREDFFGEIPD